MTRNIIFRILAGLVLLAALAGIAFFAYNAGVAHSTVINVQPGAPQTNGLPAPYYYGWGHPFPFSGLGCLIPLAVLFLVFLAFGSMRRMIWGPRWGSHHMHHQMRWSEKEWEGGVPPMVSEWHRRMHGQSEDDAAKK